MQITWRIGWPLGALLLLAVAWPWQVGAREASWERDGLEGRQVRALAFAPESRAMVALTGGARDPMPLWLRDTQGWSQPGGVAPGFILALAPLPEGGLLLGTGRDISDQPGVFLLAGSLPSARRIYDSQAVGALAVAPGQDGSDVYAASAPWADREADSELLRREPAGGSWSVLLRGSLACGQMPSYFKQVAVAPSDPDTLFALEWCFAAVIRKTQLWRSDDGGQSWQVLSRQGAAHALTTTLAIDPTDADILYLAALGHPESPATGVERSLDGGKTWAIKGEDVDELVNIRCLLVDPRDARRIVAGTEQNGVLVSEDRGETWRSLPGLEGIRIWALVLNESSDRLYAATSDGIWRLPLP